VELAAAAEGEPRVRRVAHEGGAETEIAGVIRLEEPAEPLEIRGDHADHRGEEASIDAHAEHGRVAQQRPVGRLQPVDLGGCKGFDGVREAFGRPGRPCEVEQLEEEERAPAGPARQLLDLVWAQRLLVGRELEDLDSVALGQ
jgi:hypothetical protein